MRRARGILVLILGSLGVAAPAATASELRVSPVPTRASSQPLDGAALKGIQHVFLVEEPGVTQVRFFLDDPGRTKPPRKVERAAPWDFGGTAPDGTALGWDTATVGNGEHTITAEVTTSSSVSTVTSTFTVDNAGPPDQIHVSWTGDPSTSLTFVWRTRGSDVASRVQYRPAGSTAWQEATGALRPSGTPGMLHEVTATGLSPATIYDYRVPGDDGLWSDVLQTRTAPAREGHPAFDALYYADTGLIGRTDGLATGTEQAIRDIRALDPLLVLPGGDYAYYDTDKRFGTLESTIDAWFDQWQPVLSRAATMPTYGNHEVLLGEGFAPWAARFATPDGYDGRRNFSFDIGDVHFVSILAVHETSGLPQASLDWIDDDMAAARAAGARWIVPYTHVSSFSDGTSHPSNLALRAQLGPLFERHGVKVALSSHDQNYERTYPLVDVPNSNTPTSTSLSCYDLDDGVSWVKVSPAGKLSNKNLDFSGFRTTPPPAYTAARDRSVHHFARLRVSDQALRVEIWGLRGDGSAPFVQDAFEYRVSGTCPSEPPPPPPPPPPATELKVSTSSDRSSPVPLEGSAVQGTRYVFVPAGTGITRVRFWLDDPDRAGSPLTSEGNAPWDFKGTASNGTANPWDTRAVADGEHTITAEITRSDSSRQVVHGTFTVGNGGLPAPTTHELRVSTSSTRSSPVPLEGSTLSGNRYVFVAPDSGATRVRFWLDNPAMTGTPMQSEGRTPWDFRGTASNGTALPWDTRTVAPGPHTITAAVDRSDGTSIALTATFTIAVT